MRHLRENLFVQFSVISFVVMAAIAVILVVVLSNTIRSGAIDALADEAKADVLSRLLKAITPADLEVPMTGERYDRFNEFVQEYIVSERTARVKIWARDGTVIYSNDPAGVGAKFPDNENLLMALLGETTTEIKIPEDPEYERDGFLDTLMEVYTPIIFAGTTKPAGAFEIYRYYEPTAQLINEQRSGILVSLSIGFVSLYGALVGIVWSSWRTIVRQREERTQAEEALRANAEKYRAIFDEARDGIVLTDAETGLIADCNPEFERQTGRGLTELRAMHVWELRPPDQVEAARQKFFEIREAGTGTLSELGILRPDGEETLIELVATTVEIGGKPYLQSVSRDVTERLRMEEQLRQSRLLASLGEMTAGIAHEVNNPLSAILLFSELVAKADAPAQVRKDIRVIRSEARRASNIMKGLLTYSRNQAPVARRIDLHRTIRKVIEMRRYRDQVRNIDIAVEMADGPLRVLGNTTHLTQVFMNLIVNAEEAIENSMDKRIVITTEKIGAWARISIADSGVGIPEENLTQVFVPFFSTKPVGKGTGLGLATCHGIVTAHGGLIRVENNDMGGATFVVELPLAGEAK